MLRPDFSGSLRERMAQLAGLLDGDDGLIVVGSSFGGLMGACLAIEQPGKVHRLIMLAPALNFPEYQVPEQMVESEAVLVIGSADAVTPPDIVVPAAKGTFADLQILVVDDDHLLHQTFTDLDWDHLLRLE